MQFPDHPGTTDKQATQRNTRFVKLRKWQIVFKWQVNLSLPALVCVLATATFGFATSAQARVLIGSANTTSLSNGLVGYWPLDGAVTNWNTNTTRDLSGNGNTGTLINMSTSSSPTAGKIGQALKFDGSTSIITGPAITVGTNMTIAAWIKKSNSTSQKSFFSNRGGGEVYFGLDSTHVFLYDNNASPATIQSNIGAVQIGLWQHVVATSDGSTITFYVNGRQVYRKRFSDPTALTA